MEGNSYNLNSDSTRTYTTGPLKGKTVYVDGEGYLLQSMLMVLDYMFLAQ